MGWRRTPIGTLVLDTGLRWDAVDQGSIRMRVNLHDAELTGSVAVGFHGELALTFRALISAAALSESTLALEVNRSSASRLPEPQISWQPCSVQRGSFAVGGICNSDNPTNCSCLPTAEVAAGVYYQEAYGGEVFRPHPDKQPHGGVTTAVTVQKQPEAERQMAWLSTANSVFDTQPSNASITRAVGALAAASIAGLGELTTAHRAWWGKFQGCFLRGARGAARPPWPRDSIAFLRTSH
jgi:hypothetical protein